MAAPLYESSLTSLNLINRGKVRDIYDIDDQHMLIVTTDRLSAFDVIMSTPIPDKGRVLTTVSNFWFDYLSDIVPNHLASRTLEDVLPDAAERASVEGQATVVRKLRPLPVEAIVRGYIIGSGWKDYQATGSICGIRLPPGLRLADKLEQAIYTPSTKADIGDHDENVDFETTVKLLGRERAEQVRDVSLKLYAKARDYAAERGIIIADTKFEFGLDDNDQLVLIDEALTPDSSRFWPAESYAPGTSPESYDKQYIRDWLEAQDWDKTPPAPTIPDEIIARTTEKYREACRKLTGQELD
ncbi:phosphoribosylaminoimidazolesuccinocarboxamide synthase [Sulfuriflexus sp.]|uniref:phosphoribosylaminoimidazolesuccinocarboxamide synthase n=1 Tax=Sulfuriflexus sp. TaxID=2015443 RepID=UPI0028CC7E41|nr:phosphoribosylaminoimidazolesuccinocarboxamide synthase [Sulfuriflexus sp.]MDT8403109.1 phosphoribosylaminoimidazolesuccinocarboxamide synthase [Sulfuriflexus sp.]